MFPFNFNLKLILVLGGVFVLLLTFGVVKCNQKMKDKQRIEHNNKKRDAQVEKEVQRTQLYEEKEKSNFLEKKKIKPGEGKKIKLTPEQIKKKREKNFKELEGVL